MDKCLFDRFWKSGYWKSHLAGRKYHISALYVVDLKKFRRIAAGDRLRGQYQGLSNDPNSLANLDQDLPNNMIHQVDFSIISNLFFLIYSECWIIWHPPSQLIRCWIMKCWIIKSNYIVKYSSGPINYPLKPVGLCNIGLLSVGLSSIHCK